MKKLLIIFLSILSLTAFAQSEKTVAVLEPICRDKSVKPFYLLLIRGEMESAVDATDEYVAYDRTAFDKISEEQKFQRSGAVNDSQIKRLGEIVGVDYVLVTEVSADEGYITCIAKILSVETGLSAKSKNELMELNALSVKDGCRSLAAQLLSIAKNTSSHSTTTDTEQKQNVTPKSQNSLSSPPKIAVVIAGTSEEIAKVLEQKLVANLVNNGKCMALARTSEFRRLGGNDDEGLVRVGKSMGITYICAVSVSELFGDHFIQARLISTKSLAVEKVVSSSSSMLSLNDINKIAETIAQELLSEM